MSHTYHLAVLPGDGIGPEVMYQALRVLDALSQHLPISFAYQTYPIGGAAIDAYQNPLPEETLAGCQEADAVLLGAVGGPAWDHLPTPERPEAGLLKLRQALGLYANLRPVRVPDTLAHLSPLRPEHIEGTDLLIIRELTGGIYFGTPRGQSSEEGYNTMRYQRTEVERIAHIAFQYAQRRRGKVTSVDKANVLEVSQFWRHVVSEIHQTHYPEITLEHLYVDNAAMQLSLNPKTFDVILTGNLFGDILSDAAAALSGSLGMLPSASLGDRTGLFEPVHGSAPDLVDTGKANPMAMILSTAMMLDALEEEEAAQLLRHAIFQTIHEGILTPDLQTADIPSHTMDEVTDTIIHHLKHLNPTAV